MVILLPLSYAHSCGTHWSWLLEMPRPWWEHKGNISNQSLGRRKGPRLRDAEGHLLRRVERFKDVPVIQRASATLLWGPQRIRKGSLPLKSQPIIKAPI